MTNPTPTEDILQISLPTKYPVGPVNCYLLDGPSPALVDCGPPTEEAATALRAALESRGLEPADLEAIVLTHHHIDHAGGLAWLLRESHATVMGHPYNLRWLRPDAAMQARLRQFIGWLLCYCGLDESTADPMRNRLLASVWSADYARIDRGLEEGDSAFLGTADWHVLYMPGHAGTSITLVRDDGHALVGDTLVERISSNAVVEPSYDEDSGRTQSLSAYRNSLSRLAGLELSLLLPGHGACFRRHRELIARRLHNQEQRARRLLTLLPEGGDTVGNLAKALFPGLKESQLLIGLSEALAHLDVLQSQGLVTVEEGPPARYRLSPV